MFFLSWSPYPCWTGSFLKNCRQGFCVLWSRTESRPCPAREFRKSPKFPRQGKDFHRTEGTRVQGNLSCLSSSLPHCSTLWIQITIKSQQKLKDTLLGNNCGGRRWCNSGLFYSLSLPLVWVMNDMKQHRWRDKFDELELEVGIKSWNVCCLFKKQFIVNIVLCNLNQWALIGKQLYWLLANFVIMKFQICNNVSVDGFIMTRY